MTLGMQIAHKHKYNSVRNIVYVSAPENMMTLRNFYVMSDKFKLVRICTTISYSLEEDEKEEEIILHFNKSLYRRKFVNHWFVISGTEVTCL